jgi:hypothetical protein
MRQAKRGSKRKRSRAALPVLGAGAAARHMVPLSAARMAALAAVQAIPVVGVAVEVTGAEVAEVAAAAAVAWAYG